MNIGVSWRRDFFWVVFLVVLATLFGLLHHWPLVRLAHRGGLPHYLEQMREQRRSRQFQGVKTVSLAQAHAYWQQGNTLFIDARKLEEYQELHIPGALSFPPVNLADLVSSKLADTPKDRQIVVYCSQASCDNALKVAEQLQALGYTRVMAFLGGFRAWDEAGYPVDTKR